MNSCGSIIMALSTIHPDPQHLLPEDLRDEWAVVPQDSLYQMLLVGALIGVGTALSIVGLIQGNDLLWYAFPVALILAWLQKRLFPWSERRLLKQLQDRG
jgi:hypothetical protein